MLSSLDILSIPDLCPFPTDQGTKPYVPSSNLPPSPRGRAPRRDGGHLDFGETPSSGNTKAKAHSKSRAGKRRHSSSSSSPSSDYSNSSSNSKSSSPIFQKSGSGSIHSKTGSIENERTSNNKPVSSVSSETVYEKIDNENDTKGEKLEKDL